MNRRDFLKTTGISLAALAAMCMGCGSSSATSAQTAATTVNEGAKQVMDSKTGKKILIAYYSYSGNTKALAEEIHRQAGGDLIPIVPEVPYSETYDVTVAKAKQEQQSNARPAIKTAIPNMEQYDMVLLGYPNWWGSYPMLIATFAEKFNKFVYLPWKTAEQMSERYEITKDFLRNVTSLYGIKATRYLSQFL